MKLRKRILAILMAAVMLLGMMPAVMADACDHDFSNEYWPQGEPENCLDEKPVEVTCSKCGEFGWEESYSGDCKPGDKIWPDGKPSDCQDLKGWEIRCIYCETVLDCDEERGDHDWETHTFEEPTCTETGREGSICSICGEDSRTYWETPALGHDWSDWKVEGGSNCLEPSYETRRCERCGDVEIQDGNYGDHDWGEWTVVKKPTCTEKGREERKCSLCGKVEERDIDANGHSYTEWVLIEEGDCLHPGWEERGCHNCDYEEQRDTEEGSHDWEGWKTEKEPTCTEDGRKANTCSLCGKERTESIDKLGHAWGEWTVIQEATESQVGIRERKCSRCGLTETEYFYVEGTIKPGDRDDEDSDEIEDIQEKLEEEGYDPGGSDGIYGPNTEDAIKDWQEDNGYEPNGILTPEQKEDLMGEDPDGDDPADIPDGDMTPTATLEKSIINAPANGSFYVVGEAIEYEIVFSNLCQHELHDLDVVDPLKGGNEDSLLTLEPVVDPLQVITLHFTHVVTEEDANVGSVTNTATASWWNPEINEGGTCSSNTVVADCGYKQIEYDGATVTVSGLKVNKSVTSIPANEAFYVPGETVTFMVEVTNTSSSLLTEVTVCDSLMHEAGISWQTGMLDAGATASYTFDYVVTSIDAVAGMLSNVATAEGIDMNGVKRMGVSNVVTVPTGMEDFPFGVITELIVQKEETSAPANGAYYTEGETISYLITYTNTGETDLGEVIVYDVLKVGGEVASAEMLHSGESRTCTFEHVVTADDVEMGFVANVAFAEYDVGGYLHTAMSNMVVSDTDGDEETTYIPDVGTIDWGEIRGTDENGEPAVIEDTCYVKAISRDGDSVEYEVNFCSKHKDAHAAILTMAAAADEDAKKVGVWNYALALWRQEIDAMYEELLAAADANAKITLMNERATYLAMIANTHFALRIVNPDQESETTGMITKMWQDRLVELCYLMNTAPAARRDSLLNVTAGTDDSGLGASCACVVSEEEAGKILYADMYCVQHGFTYEMADVLLMNNTTEETWTFVRSLWEIELNNAYNDLYEAASSDGGMSYLVEYAAYNQWLSAQESYLKLMYPENPEIVLEVMVDTIRSRALDVCERLY